MFVEVFGRHGVTLTLAEARGPMGMDKRAHIAALAGLPTVQQRWQTANGRAIADAGVAGKEGEREGMVLGEMGVTLSRD